MGVVCIVKPVCFKGELIIEHGVRVVLMSSEFLTLYCLVVGVFNPRVKSILEAPFRSYAESFFLLPRGFGFCP